MTSSTTQSHIKFQTEGFDIIEDVFNQKEIDTILNCLEQADKTNPTFRKTNDLFAIRQLLKELPELHALIFTDKFKSLVKKLFGEDYFVVKAIYFDKPAQSNWFVAYHQDLTISVDKRLDIPQFSGWTVKHQQFSVQPPLLTLENINTIRIHLDDTDEQNGALNVLTSSHKKGIYRPETINWENESPISCPVKKGGLMLMKPLLLHASSRTTNNQRRRVIHLEFSNQNLPNQLQWAEQHLLFS